MKPPVTLARLFHTLERRVRARGLQQGCALVVPSRGARLVFPTECEISGLAAMPFGYSMRGQCRMERRRARWFCNPKGIVSSSPGLPSPRGYPGLASVRFSTPTGLCPITTTGPQPRWGWPTPPAFPRVARGSQPWASGRNPFGIHLWNFRKALGLAEPACGAHMVAMVSRPLTSTRHNNRPERNIVPTRRHNLERRLT